MKEKRPGIVPDLDAIDYNPKELKVRLMLLGVKQQDLIEPLTEKLGGYVDGACISEALNKGLNPKSKKIRVAINDILHSWEERNRKVELEKKRREELTRKREEAKKAQKIADMERLKQFDELGFTPEELEIILKQWKTESSEK